MSLLTPANYCSNVPIPNYRSRSAANNLLKTSRPQQLFKRPRPDAPDTSKAAKRVKRQSQPDFRLPNQAGFRAKNEPLKGYKNYL